MRTKHHDDWIKESHRAVGDIVAEILSNTPITPTQLTIVRFLFGCLAGYLIIYYQSNYFFLLLAALSIYLFSMLDAADGSLAKKKGGGTVFGAWLDRVFDSLGFFIIFNSIAYHFHLTEPLSYWSSLTIMTLLIAFMVKTNNIAIRSRVIFSQLFEKDRVGNNSNQSQNDSPQLDLKTKIKRQLGPDFHKISAILIIGLITNSLKAAILFLLIFLSSWWFYKIILVLFKASGK